MSYKSLHTRFDLPPPPARSRWTLGRHHEADRAWFPDFTTAEDPTAALKSFLEDLLEPRIRRSVGIQIAILGSLVFLFFVVKIVVLIRRMQAGSTWVFRGSKRSNGILLVPNPIMSIVAITMAFPLLLAVADWISLHCIWNQQSLWIILPLFYTLWFPLTIGIYFGAVGVACARATAFECLSPQRGREPSLALRMGITPTVFSGIMFAPPVIHVATLLYPICRSIERWRSSYVKYKHWQQAWSQYTGALDRQMLLDAQDVWYTLVTDKWCNIVLVLYSIAAVLLGLGTLAAGAALVLMVRKQIKDLEATSKHRSEVELNRSSHNRASTPVHASSVAHQPGKGSESSTDTFGSTGLSTEDDLAGFAFNVTSNDGTSSHVNTQNCSSTVTADVGAFGHSSSAGGHSSAPPCPLAGSLTTAPTFDDRQGARLRFLRRLLLEVSVRCSVTSIGCFAMTSYTFLLMSKRTASVETGHTTELWTVVLLYANYVGMPLGVVVFAVIFKTTSDAIQAPRAAAEMSQTTRLGSHGGGGDGGGGTTTESAVCAPNGVRNVLCVEMGTSDSMHPHGAGYSSSFNTPAVKNGFQRNTDKATSEHNPEASTLHKKPSVTFLTEVLQHGHSSHSRSVQSSRPMALAQSLASPGSQSAASPSHHASGDPTYNDTRSYQVATTMV